MAASAIEYRQRSEAGPVALVPTLPYALAAAMLAGMVPMYLRAARGSGVAWWNAPLTFVVVLVVGVLLILAAGNRGESDRDE
ncbi:MAG TPA: hypothetical protein VER96_30035 [Polyangiaceae bacterium]|nr:hypothetical protein [Polyangiaceae bacterium]